MRSSFPSSLLIRSRADWSCASDSHKILPELDELALVLLAFWCSRVSLALFGRFSLRGGVGLSLGLGGRLATGCLFQNRGVAN